MTEPQDIYDRLFVEGVSLSIVDGKLHLRNRDGKPLLPEQLDLARHWKPQLMALVRDREAGLFFENPQSGAPG